MRAFDATLIIQTGIPKEQMAGRTLQLASTHIELGLLSQGSAKALRMDPYPYGVKSNRKTLETLAAYSFEQGLTPRQLDLVIGPLELEFPLLAALRAIGFPLVQGLQGNVDLRG